MLILGMFKGIFKLINFSLFYFLLFKGIFKYISFLFVLFFLLFVFYLFLEKLSHYYSRRK